MLTGHRGSRFSARNLPSFEICQVFKLGRSLNLESLPVITDLYHFL